MLTRAEPPTASEFVATQRKNEVIEQVSEAAEVVAGTVLPQTPFVVGGLRLDWAAKRSLDVGVAVT
ncbi:sugar transferase, partial [Methylobacterium longum]|nr:sugar transferase [Methylobacterium longum]